MAKISKTVVDKDLRDRVFDDIFGTTTLEYAKINDRQYGILITDLNGEQRYVRIGAIVAEEREDMTAEELMQREIEVYHQKQIEKAAKVREKEKKIAVDKAARELRALRAKEKEAEENEV
jgi:adenine-specific DNA methylase